VDTPDTESVKHPTLRIDLVSGVPIAAVAVVILLIWQVNI
jgi:hypothetical protein